MRLDQLHGLRLGLMQEPHHRLIDASRGFIGKAARLGDLLAEERVILAFAQINRADFGVHAPAGDHRARNGGGAADVVIGTGADRAEQQFFRRPARQQRCKLHLQIAFGQGVAFVFRQHMGAAQTVAAWDDRHLVNRVGTGIIEGGGGMTGLMHRQAVLLVGLNRQGAHRAHHHLVARFVEIGGGDVGGRAPCGGNCSLVQQVLQIGPGKPRCAGSHLIEIDGGVQRQVFHVHVKDRPPRPLVGQRQRDVAVKPAGAQQCRVQHVGAVGGGQHHHRFARGKTVEFRQDLVQGLLAFIMATAKAGAAGAPDAVQFINEDDRRCLLARLFEHLAHPARADADEDLDEFRPGGGKERHVGLTRQRPRQQRLAGARWSHQQHTMRHRGTDLLKPLGVAQEFDQFRDFALGLILPRDIGNGDLAGGAYRLGGTTAQKIADPAGQTASTANAAHHPAAEPIIEAEDHDPR